MFRPLLAVCLLVGCYQPSTDSCYYACATQGTPCPSGLMCVAGMCATPGETCDTTGGDGGIDSSIDGAGQACGAGTASIGEVCFGMPISIVTSDIPSFGQLADRDGDGDVDLVYIDKAQYSFNLNTGGLLAAGPSPGPPAPDSTAMLTADLDNSPGVELIHTSQFEIQGFTAAGMAPHIQLFSQLYPQYPPAVAMDFGKVTSSPIGALAVIHDVQLVIYRFDSPSALTEAGSYPIGKGTDVAVGPLNPDVFDDVVVASNGGVLVFLGSSLNLGSPSQVGPSTPIAGVEIGDFDRDGNGDIVFVITAAGGGTLGVLKGNPDGTFAPAVTQQIPDLGAPIAVADINRDGRSDVIAIQNGASPSVLIARGKSDGSLDAPIKIPITGRPSHVSARGDFNGDMIPDIVVTDGLGRQLLVIPSDP